MDDVTDAVSENGVLVDVVSVGRASAEDSALQQLADAGDGQVITADAEALREEFTREADILSRQILVTAELPDAVTDDEATVTVTLAAEPTALTAQAFAAVRSADESSTPAPTTAAPTTDRGLAISRTWMLGGVAALGLGLLILLVVLLVPGRSRR